MPFYDLMLSVIADRDAAAREHTIAAMESAGAVSPASAQPLRTLGLETTAAWRQLVAEGRIREGAPDHFYLFDTELFDTEPSRRRERLIKMIGFYSLIILIPIVIFLLNRR